MDDEYLLDTNLVIALFRPEESVLLRYQQERDRIFVPSIVIGELFLGAYNSGKVESNAARVREFAEVSRVLVCDAETGRVYGEIASQLRRAGRPIPENDIWIAAIARQHDLTLVTRDRHFENVEGLRRVRW